MPVQGLETDVVDDGVYEASVRRFADAGIVLPTFAELADPAVIPAAIGERLAGVSADEPDPLNLFRVHWHNSLDGGPVQAIPDHLVLPRELTGVDAPVVVLLGDRFPMIRAHKVLAAYGCLVPRIITGQFDPTRHRAVWPSTGNYCRGGVAISKIMGCRGVAVLPEGMSRERFSWLERWVTDPADIIRTPGSESNVKEIYDACAVLERDPEQIIFNQFSEFGNYLVHYLCTGRAVERVFNSLPGSNLRCRAFVSATGSAGTIGAGDYLKEHLGAAIVAVEALECPTLLYNGFGEHNIQGIGDKHVPLIHNVMNTDAVAAISDASTDAIDMLFNTPAGHAFLQDRKGISPDVCNQLCSLGFSSICNVLAAIKTARYFDLGKDDVIVTVATDGAGMYNTERSKISSRDYGDDFDTVAAAEVFGRHVRGTATDHFIELSHVDRKRIFNLGYFTWVEQQGISIEDFERRRHPSFWRDLRNLPEQWDAGIKAFNERTGVVGAS
jgi:cysteine synthase